MEIRLKLTLSSSNNSQVKLRSTFLNDFREFRLSNSGLSRLIDESTDQNPTPTVYESFLGTDKTKLGAFVNVIQSASSDHICNLKTGRKGLIIPKNQITSI